MSRELHAHFTADGNLMTGRLISRPSLSHADGKPLYFQAPPPLHEATKPNLGKLVKELVVDGDDLVVTDPQLPFTLTVTVTYV